ncbi:MAG: hypothetical protein M1816_006527 [Peltula sp. TS41687]|nr:MAG: hypothetical protein M1816_006527 [Peltula sp. TS41687]
MSSSMFLPRQLTIKRKKDSEDESPRPKKLKQDSPPPTKDASTSLSSVRRPSITSNNSTTYDQEIVYGLELILSDYAYTHEESAAWLKARERTLRRDGKDIHLSAVLDHQVFSKTKPPLTQTAVQRALRSQGSGLLELSPDGYHFRRRRFQPAVPPVEKEHERDWDAQTIYAEPHLSSLAANAPRLIHHLLHHSTNLPGTLHPIQNVQSRHPSWAFVTFSGPIDEVESRGVWPDDWIVLTKKEHAKRDEEYRSLIPLHRGDRRAGKQDRVDDANAEEGWKAENVRDVRKREASLDGLVDDEVEKKTEKQRWTQQRQTRPWKDENSGMSIGKDMSDKPVNKHIRFQS